MMPGVAARPRVIAVMGSTGCGKSTWLKRELLTPAPPRLVVWDYSPVPEYAHVARYVSLPELIRGTAAPTFRLAYQAPHNAGKRQAAFALWCRAVLRAGNCVAIVEELRYVTTPSRSPDDWAAMVMTGRKAGLVIVGTSQRPSHVDKDFLGNATALHCGALGYDADVETMTREMRLDAEQRARLSGLKPLEWMHKDRETGLVTAGKLKFSRRGIT